MIIGYAVCLNRHQPELDTHCIKDGIDNMFYHFASVVPIVFFTRSFDKADDVSNRETKFNED